MPEINLKVFTTAVDVLALFSTPARMPVYVVEKDTSLGLRPFTRDISVGLVIPKARPGSRGLSYTPGEMRRDDGDGIPLGAFLDLQGLKRLLRGVRHNRLRGDTTAGEVRFDPAQEPSNMFLYEPGSYMPITAPMLWTMDATPPRLPVYLSATSGGDRISAFTLKALGTAGSKMSPTSVWTVSDGRWEMQSPEGLTLRVAAWPTNTQEGSS